MATLTIQPSPYKHMQESISTLTIPMLSREYHVQQPDRTSVDDSISPPTSQSPVSTEFHYSSPTCSPMQLRTPSSWGTPRPSIGPDFGLYDQEGVHSSESSYSDSCRYMPEDGRQGCMPGGFRNKKNGPGISHAPQSRPVIPQVLLSSWLQHQQLQIEQSQARRSQRLEEQYNRTKELHDLQLSPEKGPTHSPGISFEPHNHASQMFDQSPNENLRRESRTRRSSDDSSTAMILLRGLPFTATEVDILKFFTSHGLNNVSSVEILKKSDGRPSGQARVGLKGTTEDAYAAKESLQWQWMANRYIEVFVELGDDDRRYISNHRRHQSRQHPQRKVTTTLSSTTSSDGSSLGTTSMQSHSTPAHSYRCKPHRGWDRNAINRTRIEGREPEWKQSGASENEGDHDPQGLISAIENMKTPIRANHGSKHGLYGPCITPAMVPSSSHIRRVEHGQSPRPPVDMRLTLLAPPGPPAPS